MQALLTELLDLFHILSTILELTEHITRISTYI